MRESSTDLQTTEDVNDVIHIYLKKISTNQVKDSKVHSLQFKLPMKRF